MSRYVTATAEVDVGLDEFDDDDILEEAQMRGLVPRDAKPPTDFDVREEAVSAQQHLCCNRIDRARTQIQTIIEQYVPAEFLTAMDCIRNGKIGAAIYELDRFIEPPPSRTATHLPAKFAAEDTP